MEMLRSLKTHPKAVPWTFRNHLCEIEVHTLHLAKTRTMQQSYNVMKKWGHSPSILNALICRGQGFSTSHWRKTVQGKRPRLTTFPGIKQQLNFGME
jgi:hypothetical protein